MALRSYICWYVVRLYVHCISSENLRSSLLCVPSSMQSAHLNPFAHTSSSSHFVARFLFLFFHFFSIVSCCSVLRMLMKNKFRQIHKILQGKRRIETRNIVDSKAKKAEGVWVEEILRCLPFSLYLFDINEMVKSSVKNSINLFWLTSSFFLLSVLLSLPFQLNSFVRCAEEDRWINLRVIRNEGQGGDLRVFKLHEFISFVISIWN